MGFAHHIDPYTACTFSTLHHRSSDIGKQEAVLRITNSQEDKRVVVFIVIKSGPSIGGGGGGTACGYVFRL